MTVLFWMIGVPVLLIVVGGLWLWAVSALMKWIFGR
jgi:hypothetical protein